MVASFTNITFHLLILVIRLKLLHLKNPPSGLNKNYQECVSDLFVTISDARDEMSVNLFFKMLFKMSGRQDLYCLSRNGNGQSNKALGSKQFIYRRPRYAGVTSSTDSQRNYV